VLAAAVSAVFWQGQITQYKALRLVAVSTTRAEHQPQRQPIKAAAVLVVQRLVQLDTTAVLVVQALSLFNTCHKEIKWKNIMHF
jgi:hypothetical protein